MRFQNPLIATIFAASSTVFAQSDLSVDWEWKRAHQCRPISPELSVSGIPSEATTLEISLVDRDYSAGKHGGGTIERSAGAENVIPEGALKSYKGPCPPNFHSFGHDYEFTVRAIAADGKTELARGTKTKTFSAKAVKE